MSRSTTIRWKILFSLALVLCGVGCLHADEAPLSRSGLFPKAYEVFHPLLADPRQTQMSLRWVVPVSHKSLGDISIGDEWGWYRWNLAHDAVLQVGFGASVFARFDLVADRKDLEVLDFYVNMPVDLKIHRWSFRILPNHVSSHFGDDYIIDHEPAGFNPPKYSVDSEKMLASYDVNDNFRLYAGYEYIIRTLRTDLGRWSLQSGFEAKGPWIAHGHAQLYWANDLQNWQRTGWNPQINSQAGIKLRQNPQDTHGFSIFTEYSAGHLPYGQFYDRIESRWVLAGLRFDLQ